MATGGLLTAQGWRLCGAWENRATTAAVEHEGTLTLTVALEPAGDARPPFSVRLEAEDELGSVSQEIGIRAGPVRSDPCLRMPARMADRATNA
jgi:hypothetical protein